MTCNLVAYFTILFCFCSFFRKTVLCDAVSAIFGPGEHQTSIYLQQQPNLGQAETWATVLWQLVLTLFKEVNVPHKNFSVFRKFLKFSKFGLPKTNSHFSKSFIILNSNYPFSHSFINSNNFSFKKKHYQKISFNTFS